MGLVLVVLDASLGDPGWDVVPDPVGWLLVLLGVRRLPAPIGHRPLLGALAVLAGVVAVVLWVPPLAAPALDLDESLRWVLDLPTPAFVLVLALSLAAAADGRDRPARSWWRMVQAGTVATMLLPAVVYGAGAPSAAGVAAVVAVGTVVTCVVLCFAHASRPWAHAASSATVSGG